jgi:hypothetical protein
VACRADQRQPLGRIDCFDRSISVEVDVAAQATLQTESPEEKPFALLLSLYTDPTPRTADPFLRFSLRDQSCKCVRGVQVFISH